MKSKFRYWAYFSAALSVVFSVMMGALFVVDVLNTNIGFIPFSIACLFFLFVWAWLFFGEMRTKVISVEIYPNAINVRRYLGLWFNKSFPVGGFDGYKTSIIPSRSGNYEYLYLIIDGEKIIKISEFYHANYKELKRTLLTKNIKNLGFEPYSSLGELKEIFT